MIHFSVPDISCGHCVSAVTKAVHGVDDNAMVSVDLPARTVSIDTSADPAVLSKALDEAGYPATRAVA